METVEKSTVGKTSGKTVKQRTENKQCGKKTERQWNMLNTTSN